MKPSKEQVRVYMQVRTAVPKQPIPTMAEIRRQLGWDLIPMTLKQQASI